MNITENAPASIDETPSPIVFTCPAYRYEEFVKRVDKANRRLERAGGSERFAFTFETFEVEKRRPTLFFHIDGSTEPTGIFEPWFRATLVNDSFRIKVGSHTFVASLIAEEAGYTVHTAPGQSLNGWARPAVDDIHCDVCNTVRRRQNIYIVRDEETGTLIQVGTNCLAPLLGFSPQSLWALTWTQELSDLTEDSDEDGWAGYRGAADRTVSIDSVLAIAWAVTNGGKNYVSTKAADAYYEAGGHGKASTVSQIRSHLAGRPRPFRGDDSLGREWDEVQAKVEAVTIDTVAAIGNAVESVKTGTDYGDNLRTILAAPSGRVTYRNVGILGSLVSVYSREQQSAQERKQEALSTVSGFLGEVKERIRNFSITLSSVRELDSDWGTTTLLVGKTPDGHVVKWFASGSFDYDLGDVITFEAATVKAQENYKGTDQTVITRGKIGN